MDPLGEIFVCRSGQLIFVLSNWMSDPKCTSEIRNRWLDIWEQVRAHIGGGDVAFSLLWFQADHAGVSWANYLCLQGSTH